MSLDTQPYNFNFKRYKSFKRNYMNKLYIRANSLHLLHMLPKFSSGPQRHLVLPEHTPATTDPKRLGTPICVGEVKTCNFK